MADGKLTERRSSLTDEAAATLLALAFLGLDVEPWLEERAGCLPRTGYWSTVSLEEKQEIAARLVA